MSHAYFTYSLSPPIEWAILCVQTLNDAARTLLIRIITSVVDKIVHCITHSVFISTNYDYDH